jgi:hypothetical protein
VPQSRGRTAEPQSGPNRSAAPRRRIAVAIQAPSTARTVDRVEAKIALGPNAQSDDRVEITKAFQDFHGGKFGDVPRQARLKYQ